MLKKSSANSWPFLKKFIRFDQRFGGWARSNGSWALFGYEFLRFGIKQAWACLYGALLLFFLLGSHFFYPRDFVLPRYDFLVIVAVLVQFAMVFFGLESRREARIIFLFHFVGTVMEIFKTNMGSWRYPELSYLKIGGVPLFTGFMYASVGSYLARVWKLFDFRFNIHPTRISLVVLSILIYGNFFSHHYIFDVRYLLFAVSAYLFYGSWVHFKVAQTHRKMPMLLGLLLVTLFIWFAENIGTFASAWVYPDQEKSWKIVSFAKFGSWYLLMLISYSMVYVTNFSSEKLKTSF